MTTWSGDVRGIFTSHNNKLFTALSFSRPYGYRKLTH